MIPKGVEVVFSRIYSKRGLVEIVFEGLSGLFDLNCFEILKSKDFFDENLCFDNNESKKVPKVLQRKKMMEDREEKSRTPIEMKDKKVNQIKEFDKKTVCTKKDEGNNWNYGKITFFQK